MIQLLMALITFLLLWAPSVISCFGSGNVNVEKPNVIIVLTDDQGIGDLSCHGNPYLKTPHLDAFYQDAVRLTNFHVSPLCTPTRAALMTGQYPITNGAWATFKGRDALPEGMMTMADIFKTNGYKTGLFGKWHLGDNYPVRPFDCGFDLAIHHKAGGVGELSDYWGNNYFDDVYFVNNKPQQFKGYCTDVWFEEAKKFIETYQDQPFFIYLSTNAPHSPLVVPEQYSSPYKAMEGQDIQSDEYLGMIANIDENFGQLDQWLKEKGLAENTILIFLTDNGTQFGFNYEKGMGFNKGFRGNKSSKLEGGHRVPFFIRWPKGNLKGGRDIHELSAHVDLLPTLVSLCDMDIPKETNWDGIDFSRSLLEEDFQMEDRTVFIHHRQDWRSPHDIANTCILKNKWRLIDGTELYNIEKDPLQLQNIAKQYPLVVEELLYDNRLFLKSIKQNKSYRELPVQVVGTSHQKEIKLTIQHAIGEDVGIWKPEQVAAGIKNTNNTHALRIAKKGRYQIACRRWPKECPGSIQGIPSKNPKQQYIYKRIKPEKVRIKIANQMIEKIIEPDDEEVVFDVQLEAGKTFLVNDFIEDQQTYGVYYTYVKLIEEL